MFTITLAHPTCYGNRTLKESHLEFRLNFFQFFLFRYNELFKNFSINRFGIKHAIGWNMDTSYDEHFIKSNYPEINYSQIFDENFNFIARCFDKMHTVCVVFMKVN